jgi:MFS transporter, ACS family, tartrate transporter
VGNGSGVFAHPLIGRLHDVTGSFAGAVWALAAFSIAAIATIQLIIRTRPVENKTILSSWEI